MQPGQDHDQLLSIFTALLILTTLLSLYIFRPLDDNRLVSWLWVFADISALKFFFVMVMGLLIAYPLSKITLTERNTIFLLSAASFLITAFFWQEPEMIIDSSRYFVQAKYLNLYGISYFLKEWGNEIPAWTDLPLIPFIYGVIFQLFGEHRINIQIFNSLLFTGTIILTYLIGKTLWNKTIGLSAGALLLGMPYLMVQVPLMMIDIATMFFLTLATFTTIKASESGKMKHCLFASLAITLAMLTKYSNWLMLSIIPAILSVQYRYNGCQYNWKSSARCVSALTLGVVFLMGIFVLTKFDLILEQLHLLLDFQAPALYRWQESWTSTFLFQIHPVISMAALFSCYIAIKKKDAKYLIICWLVILVLLLEIKRIRYTIAVFPMLAIMASYAIATLQRTQIRKYIVACTVISAVLISANAYLPFVKNSSTINLKLAGEYLDSINANDIEVFILAQTNSSINPSIALAMLDLYTARGTVYYHRDISNSSPPQKIAELPWRWTWEIGNPQYLSEIPKARNKLNTVVVVQSEVDQLLPGHVAEKISHYRLTKEFNVSDRAFKYQTIVKIFQPERVN